MNVGEEYCRWMRCNSWKSVAVGLSEVYLFLALCWFCRAVPGLLPVSYGYETCITGIYRFLPWPDRLKIQCTADHIILNGFDCDIPLAPVAKAKLFKKHR